MTEAKPTASLPRLTPRLIVPDADAAIAFYRDALGAELVERFEDPTLGKVVHAAVRIGPMTLSLAEAHDEFDNRSPDSLGGSAVLLQLEVEDALAVGEKMKAHGADELIPIEDRFYGKRAGRLRDPSGHLWIVSQQIEDLDDEAIRRRIASFHD
jgi:PhnB protein